MVNPQSKNVGTYGKCHGGVSLWIDLGSFSDYGNEFIKALLPGGTRR